MMENSARPQWTAAEMDAYERAHALLNAVIAAYSGRIGSAPTSQAAQALRQERAPLLAERDTLTASDSTRIEEIIQEMPSRLAALREGGNDE
ncbi:hypothetical protein ACGF5T_33660 [Streptomyces sp. NPDC047853]|uniref:hypothetical protein n=1 Tax=unclassified Streptomyces TaxID=2593676 RepID=UPI003456EE9B